MKIGRYEVGVHNHGFFRLDGGAMFGVVPKAIWEKLTPPDAENRIVMATRSLIIKDGKRKLTVDLGCGDKWNAKSREIFGLADQAYVPVAGVTDVLLTHLHFDHAGGICRFKTGNEEIEPCYPDAIHYVSKENCENARRPNVREKASYLAENVKALDLVNSEFVCDGQELWPGLILHRSDGHTLGMLWLTLSDGGVTVAFPTDLCPTSKHLPLPFALGYDMCASTEMLEKEAFLKQAVDGGWIVVFEHDPQVAAARLGFDERGRVHVQEVVQL